jgi:hypothetical protein
MIQLQLDTTDFIRAAVSFGAAADQMAFIMMKTLNEAAEKTRSYLIENTWPSHVQVRNRRFLNAALTTRGTRATKTNLSVEIYDRLKRAKLETHARGGTRTGKGGRIAIPSARIDAARGSSGVPRRLLPANLKDAVKIGDNIFVRPRGAKRKKGGGRSLELAYSLRASTRIPKSVPFHEDFARVMRQSVLQVLGANVARAMARRAK